MEFDELKAKYTELREFALETLRYEYRERADWNILFGVCRDLDKANEALKRENKVLREENEELKGELKHNEELIKREVYNDFNCIIKEKEEKFEIDFPPIEPIEE